MRQVLVRWTTTIVIDIVPSPDNELDYVMKEVSQRTNIPIEMISITAGGRHLKHDEPVPEFLDMNVKILGGFPSFGLIAGQVVGAGTLITVCQFFLTLMLGGCITYTFMQNKSLGIMSAFHNIPPGLGDFQSEAFIVGLSSFIIATTISMSIVLNKGWQCKLDVPKQDVAIGTVLPFVVFFAAIFFIQNRGTSYSMQQVFFATGVLFMACACLNVWLAEQTLAKWQTDTQMEQTMLQLVVEFLAVFLILRFLLFVGNVQLGGFSSALWAAICIFFAYTAISPDYMRVFIHLISSHLTVCPK